MVESVIVPGKDLREAMELKWSEAQVYHTFKNLYIIALKELLTC